MLQEDLTWYKIGNLITFARHASSTLSLFQERKKEKPKALSL